MNIQVVRQWREMRALSESLRAQGKRIAVVPTMGFLHEGHLSLIRQAKERADVVIFTLFVNPTQFAEGEDLADYPRDEEGDVAKAEAAGATFAFCPDSLYEPGYQTIVDVQELRGPLCGISRPTHFLGVATVVTKLFNITLPHVAVFGKKDFQQLALIRQMTVDLNFDVEILGGEIVREPDGLAMSSRNKYLTPEQRKDASLIRQALQEIEQSYKKGITQADTLVALGRKRIESSAHAKIDYLEIRDGTTLKLTDNTQPGDVALAAVYFGKARLLDNLEFQ